MSKNKSNLEKLSRKIFPLIPLKENGEKYIGYCNYHQHRGVIGTEKAKVCERRECNYYQRFYLK